MTQTVQDMRTNFIRDVRRHSHIMRKLITLLLLVAVILAAGCISFPGAARVSGKFVHRETGTYAVFRDNGEFYYSFKSDSPVVRSDGLPRRLGFYSFDRATDTTPYLNLNSFDAGQFTVRFSESHDRFYLAYPDLFTGERVYEKLGDK